MLYIETNKYNYILDNLFFDFSSGRLQKNVVPEGLENLNPGLCMHIQYAYYNNT